METDNLEDLIGKGQIAIFWIFTALDVTSNIQLKVRK